MNNPRLKISLFVIYFTTTGVFGLLMMRSVFRPFMLGLEGHSQSKLEGPRVCHSCHLHAWAAAQPGLPLPEQAKSLAMPLNQGIRLDDREGVAPIEPSGESAESETNGVSRPARLSLPLNIQSELCPQKSIPGGDGHGPETERDIRERVQENCEDFLNGQ